jgi:hypothetical protein
MSSSISNSEQGLIKLTISFVVSAVVVFGASEVLLRYAVVPQDSFRAHIQLFNSAESSHAAFGDSHVARDFVPDSAMVNLAYPSEGIAHMDWKVRTYFNERQPGRVIVQADPHQFATYRLYGRLGNYPENFTEENPRRWQMFTLDPRLRPQLSALWWTFLTAGGKLESQIERRENGALLSKGDLSRVNPRRREFMARQRIDLHRRGDPESTAALMATYSQMLNFLHEGDATLCLVTLPLSPTYLQALDSRTSEPAKRSRHQLLEFFRNEAQRLGATYVDDQRSITARASFRDVDHLNFTSAPAYSRNLLRACFGAGGD